MVPTMLTLLAIAAFVGGTLIWSQRRRQSILPPMVPADGVAPDSVRVDVNALSAIPSIAPALADLKWAKVRKLYPGRPMLSGVVVFGPKRMTWAPDDQARSVGMGSWQLAWADVTGGSVQTATDTSFSELQLSLADGGTLSLVGIEEAAALSALRQRVEPTSDEPTG